ncbi:DNA processing protein DprA [Thalassobaculum fulvum]|uniref:DNA processing protein DprA n=1 Tax=Thalassobaculum fulvum TaxID=1633335 RepID=A0A919CPK2_9PROT|nr:DNA-processing protein DprA [Thalassobaculum fulvum]GHD49483.1 DNA processing protein DprA [Thalassobaculum fulvum]
MPAANDSLPERERLDRLRLIRTENVGPVTFRQLLARYRSATATLEALPDLARRGGRRRPLKVPTAADIDREITANRRAGARLLVLGDSGYPVRLAATSDAPPCLSVAGDPALLARSSVAVVGARNASLNGARFAGLLARAFGVAGFAVVSGLARGIDAAAHQGSLATGTVAVLAGGIDVVYPPEHADLLRRIAESGAAVAEMPVGTVPQARHFPSRNRIIAGLSLGTVVVEAARRSGSLITARRALDQGREVFAVPGSPLDPRCSGCNALIQEGAALLVQEADDVLDVLRAVPPAVQAAGSLREDVAEFPAVETDDTARRLILDALGPEPVPVDELIRGCQLSAPIVATVLLEAELAGQIDRYPGNLVARRLDAPA